jgi:uncharacterized protein (DUF342 family)
MNPTDHQVHVGDVENVTLTFPGRVEITGSVRAGGIVHAGGDILIRGMVDSGHVESSGGGVYADQGIQGPGAVVRAFGDIKSKVIRDAEVESLASVYVRDMIFKSSVRARHLIEMKEGDGIVESSYAEAGMEITVRSVGSVSSGMPATTLVLENFRQKELFELSMIYEQRLAQKTSRIAELEKVISVIRILGGRIVNLEPRKKAELALKVKEYQELKQQVVEVLRERDLVGAEREKSGGKLRSITSSGEVFPGVEVRIDNARVLVNRRYNNVIFYKSGIVIIGDLDAFMQRKRLSN